MDILIQYTLHFFLTLVYALNVTGECNFVHVGLAGVCGHKNKILFSTPSERLRQNA